MKAVPPAKKGYAMPAEWEPHEATWVSWPHEGCLSFPGSYDKVIKDYASMVATLAQAETVRINVRDQSEEAVAREMLRSLGAERVEFFRIPTNEPWCRDHGPIFLKRDRSPRVIAVNFGFNAWGWKLAPFEEDDEVPRRMGKSMGMQVVDQIDFILEGGSVDVNGAGTCLVTESCLLNANRNPDFDRAGIESMLRDYLGVQQVLWLGDGIVGDDTDGHVDDIARFVSEDTVLAVVEEDSSDPNYEPLQLNLERLRGFCLPDGRSLNVRTLPMPSKIERDGQRLPASYANFYIANGIVAMPVFGEPADTWAKSILQDVFPDREVVPIDCREIIWGLGAIHCLTQQQPAGK